MAGYQAKFQREDKPGRSLWYEVSVATRESPDTGEVVAQFRDPSDAWSWACILHGATMGNSSSTMAAIYVQEAPYQQQPPTRRTT
ncbi:MAG: hypothetical protein GY753_16940 [Gammaproteobacteria bacterium]|nr:hypothetical protein [Gammaproteobacteria bacterium]